jgi:hypothetical protein
MTFKHKTSALALCALAVALLFGPRTGWSQSTNDGPVFAVGVKAWENQWTSWYPALAGNGTTRIKVVETVSSDYHFALIPQASVRYGDWLLSGSYFTSTNYSLNGIIDPETGFPGSLSATRKEWDAAAGYYVLPGVAFTLGYKQIEQEYGPETFKWEAPTIGVSGSAALRSPLALYGTFIIGFPRMHASVVDDAGNNSYSANYLLGEFGASYSIAVRGKLGLTATLGYRAQTVTTKDYAVATGFNGFATVNVHDITQGPTFGVIARY